LSLAAAAFARVPGCRATQLALSLQGGAKRRTRNPDGLATFIAAWIPGSRLRAPRKGDAE